MSPADFQARMLELLAEDPATALERLRQDPSSAPWRDWLDAADPRMVRVAGELVRRWSSEGDWSASEQGSSEPTRE